MSAATEVLDGTRILCADDSQDVLAFLRIFLTGKGATVVVCDSAERAIAILAEERFDVLISDLSMPPGLDGYDLAHTLRKMENDDPARKATPSILISSDALRPSRKRRFADFQVYMPKPFHRERLLHVIERLVEADSAAVETGSLGGWEALQATEAALIATDVAAVATAAAVEATLAASNATAAATEATAAAVIATDTASKAEIEAHSASVTAPS
jgi:CheY-like chemotaxis protein